jgi:DNA-binding response OmpR family regulator
MAGTSTESVDAMTGAGLRQMHASATGVSGRAADQAFAMPKSHILVVDDDRLLCRSLAYSLDRAGYRVDTVCSAEDALAWAQRDPPDLVLLDIGLPGMDGLEALRRFQSASSAPVIFLTARRRSLEEVIGLELGADDYITKPYDPDVLLARIKTALRRAQRPAQPAAGPLVVEVGDLVIDPRTHGVTCAGQPVDLPPRAFGVLYALAQRPGEIVPADDLLAQVWGAEYAGEPQVVYVHIRWLREKLEADPNRPRRILTVHGAGYKLVPQEA